MLNAGIGGNAIFLLLYCFDFDIIFDVDFDIDLDVIVANRRRLPKAGGTSEIFC